MTRPCIHKSRLVNSGWSMSALPPKADIRQPEWRVRYVPEPDIGLMAECLRRDSFDVDFVDQLLEHLKSLLPVTPGELECDVHTVNFAANCFGGH